MKINLIKQACAALAFTLIGAFTTIAAPYDGAVVEIDVSPGKQVDSDAVLAVIENEGE